MLLFMAIWGTIVYFPMVHMVWGGGFMSGDGAIPCLDFAGGTVVHISSGVSALVVALYLGKRIGYPSETMRPHNLTLAFIGACMLWVGWFGFNAGSALAADGLAAAAFVNTHFAASAAVLGWLVVEWLRDGKPSILGGNHRSGRGPRCDHAGLGLCRPDGLDPHRTGCRSGLLLLRRGAQGEARLRRLA